FQRHDSSPDTAACHDLVTRLQLTEHGLPFLLLPVLRVEHPNEQQNDGKEQDEACASAGGRNLQCDESVHIHSMPTSNLHRPQHASSRMAARGFLALRICGAFMYSEPGVLQPEWQAGPF